MASQYYNLCWASGKAIDRSLTNNLPDARVMAKVMSLSTNNYSSQTIMIIDDDCNPVEFFNDGNRFAKIEE